MERKVIRKESDRNKRVFNYRMGYTDYRTHTLAETGSKFEISPARVQQICNRIVRKKIAEEKLEKELIKESKTESL